MGDCNLVLIGGPPGVGKSSVARIIASELESCAWVEGDDLWRIKPFEVTEETKAMVESNIVHVLRGFLEARYRLVVLTWVLHRKDLIERLLAPLHGLADSVQVVHLVADPDCLRRRVESEPDRGRSTAVALERLQSINQLTSSKLDTTEMSAREAAGALLDVLGASRG